MTNAALRLIVGLGNPGAEYTKTRHNAGFWFCERLAQQLDVPLKSESRFKSLVGNVRSDGIWLLLPQTFMNDSGQAVRAFTQFHKIQPAEMLVVHDELDIPPGQLRLKLGGGAGGHNGLKDISSHLASQDYWRLRVGIGHPGDRNEVINYVLKPPRQEERSEIDQALARALESWPQLKRAEFHALMQHLNRR